MTAPATRKPRTPRPAGKAPESVPQPEPPRWPAIGADAETLRAMPAVAYLWAEHAPPAGYDPVITAAADKQWREASAAMRALPGACRAMASDWEAKAREAVFGRLDKWLAGTLPPAAPAAKADEPAPAAAVEPTPDGEQAT